MLFNYSKKDQKKVRHAGRPHVAMAIMENIPGPWKPFIKQEKLAGKWDVFLSRTPGTTNTGPSK